MVDTLQRRKKQGWTRTIWCFHIWIGVLLCLLWGVQAAEQQKGGPVVSTTKASEVKRSTLPPLNHKDPFKDLWETPTTVGGSAEKKDKLEVNDRKLRGVIVPELRERLVFSSNGEVEERGLYPFPTALVRTFRTVPCSPDVSGDWPCLEEENTLSGSENQDKKNKDKEKKDKDNDSKNPTRSRRQHGSMYGGQNPRGASQEGEARDVIYDPELLVPSGYPPNVMYDSDGYEHIVEEPPHTLGSHMTTQLPVFDVVVNMVRRAARDPVLREATKELVSTVLDGIFDRIVESSPHSGKTRDGAAETSGTMGNRRGSGQVNRDGAGSEGKAEGEEAFNVVRDIFVDFMRLVKGSGDVKQRASWGEGSSHQRTELHLPTNQIRVVDLPRNRPRNN